MASFSTPLLLLLSIIAMTASISQSSELPIFREAPAFRNAPHCSTSETIHIAMTLDTTYLRGSIAAVHSILWHTSCPENIHLQFLSSTLLQSLNHTILTTFPNLSFTLHHFDTGRVAALISYSLRRALDQPLNYARIYLADLLPQTLSRIIYFDSDLILVDDVAKLWNIDLKGRVLGAPEYCHANFSHYFTPNFWSNPGLSKAFVDRVDGVDHRRPCYFNTGVMVLDLVKWRTVKCTAQLEKWMRVQKRFRIYELGSLPPFLLVFAGRVERIEHRWNQHGLGGDNVKGLCRDLHPGPVSLLHWSGKGKPWLRVDAGRECPLDRLWIPYDLFRHETSSSLFDDS